MYLNPKVPGLIPTKGKNSTSEGGREDHEVIVPGTLKARAVTLHAAAGEVVYFAPPQVCIKE